MGTLKTIAALHQTAGRMGVLRLLPGVLLLAVTGYAGKPTEQAINAYGKGHHLALPNIEYVLWAILFRALIANVFEVPKVFQPGIATYDFWLKLGIVFLGVRFLLGDVLKLGGVSIIFVAVELGISIALMSLLGKWFGLSPKLTSLLAIGSSICGVSAIVAAKGAIEADDEGASYAIAAILALGAFSLFTFPAIGHALGLSDHAFGLWAGLAVDNTAEATAAGFWLVANFDFREIGDLILLESCRCRLKDPDPDPENDESPECLDDSSLGTLLPKDFAAMVDWSPQCP